MLRKKSIKALKVRGSFKLFFLLCFFFVSKIYSQTFYGDKSAIFIKEGTVLSLNKKPDSLIYIEQGTVISGVEYINNTRIVYEKSQLKEKKQHVRNTQVHKKERVAKKKEYITEKPKITIRKNENEQNFSFFLKHSIVPIASSTDSFKISIIIFSKTEKLLFIDNKKEKQFQYRLTAKDTRYFKTNKIRPPPQRLNSNFLKINDNKNFI